MSARLLDTFTGRVRLEGILTTITGLHIGAGGSGDPLASDSPVIRNAAGQPFIPGSSLKGVIRSAAEALLRGSVITNGAESAQKSPRRACNQVAGGDLACVTHKREKELREKFRGEGAGQTESDFRGLAQAIWEESCFVCRLFGSPALGSRVRFPDLPLAEEAPFLELRNGVGIHRDREVAAPGVLYDLEAVPPDTRFRLTLVVDNPEDAEVGLLLFLFEQLSEGNLAIGGKTSRGLGSVKVDWKRIVETGLHENNPFDQLIEQRILAGGSPPREPEAEPGEAPLPETGDPEVWKQLTEILQEIGEVDKTLLGERASKLNLNKATLNEKLQLGLDPPRRAWDEALKLLAQCGFLIKEGRRYRLSGTADKVQKAQERQEPTADPASDRALEECRQRFLKAAAKWWEEMS